MTRLTRSLALTGMLGLALAGATYTTPAAAREVVLVTSRVAPPPPRLEHVPPPRRGYVWAPGFWQWSPRVNRHVWVDGTWVRARPGYRYAPGRWERNGGGWQFYGGGWVR
jgi:hypothetical protein